jgi:hypothetical protein
MQIIVQEGEVLVSLTSPIQAPDESLRTTSVNTVSGPVKAYYRDMELIRVEDREGNLELLPTIIGAVTWVKKDRRYQLKTE